MSFELQDLTGAQFDELEEILGGPYDQAHNVKLSRATGYIRRKAEQPGLTWEQWNQLPVKDQIAAAGFKDEDEDEDTEGKDEPAGRHASVTSTPLG